jgi:uncharacterized protein (DUF885 family)
VVVFALGAVGSGASLGCGHATPVPHDLQGAATGSNQGTGIPGGAGPTSPPSPEDAEVAKACEAYIALIVAIDPETATTLGLHARDSELEDRTLEGFEEARRREEAMLADVRAAFVGKSTQLSAAARIDLELLEHTLDVRSRLARKVAPLERDPTSYTRPLDPLFLMMARDYAPAAERAKAALARMEKLPAMLELAHKNLKNPPRVWTQVAIDMARSAKGFFDDERPLLEAALPEPGQKVHIAAVVKQAEAAFAGYAAFLEKDVLPRSTGSYALGRETFDMLLHDTYFLREDADAVLALGQRVFEKTQKELAAVAHRIDPAAASWADVAQRLKQKHPTADNLLASYRDEMDRARRFLELKDVVPLPAEGCEVIETPPFQRTTITAAYDLCPPFDPSAKGFFFVTPVDKSLPSDKQEAMLRENDHGDAVDTVVHETYPGHHLQQSFARRHPSVLRKATDAAIFAEGWGLYAEELMGELGYYTDEERLMQLEWTLVRAARVLIDVGLHTKGMSFDDAIKILTDQVHLELPLATSEVKRYTMSPTQPLSYLVGREAILAIRDRAKKLAEQRGAPFSLKAFHADLLGHGTIPPGLVAKEMFGEVSEVAD